MDLLTYAARTVVLSDEGKYPLDYAESGGLIKAVKALRSAERVNTCLESK